jgi:hypothetical protein
MRLALAFCALALAPALAAAQGESDNVIDDRIRSSAQAAESFQGPLDGAWTLVSADGKPLYAFQLVDKPGGQGPLEGVWRDLRRPSMPGDIGLIDALDRGPQTLSISFIAKPGDPRVAIELKSHADGDWSGDLLEHGMLTPVQLRRR